MPEITNQWTNVSIVNSVIKHTYITLQDLNVHKKCQHCHYCHNFFDDLTFLIDNIYSEHSGFAGTCWLCGKTFTRKDYLTKHIVNIHCVIEIKCNLCGEILKGKRI